MDGHAAAGSDAALAVAYAVVHLAAMSVWLGGLLVLLLVVLAPGGTADRLGRRSLVAYGAVCLLVLVKVLRTNECTAPDSKAAPWLCS